LAAIRNEAPDILISDLNMPGMSGFELLCLVRRHFPAIQVVAMSGMFSGDEVPSGVAADAFYQKGTGLDSLLRIMQELPLRSGVFARPANRLKPVSIRHEDHEDWSETAQMISCPECLGMISQIQSQTVLYIRGIVCVKCSSLVQSAFAPCTEEGSLLQLREKQEHPLPVLNRTQRIDN
jgi:CheY-like chemotaxis protein